MLIALVLLYLIALALIYWRRRAWLLDALVPGLLALIFGWLAFRSRVTGVYLSILTQAMTLALALYLFQNDSGLRGNNGLSGLQNLPGAEAIPQSTISLWFLWASALAVSYTHLTLPTTIPSCRSRWSPYH